MSPPYQTFSDLGPYSDTGISASDVQVIPHNPLHPNRDPVWPEKYPELVRPTNDQMRQVTVSDEAWTLADIDQASQNRLYLHHKPTFRSTITVSDGVLNTALTDYENGIIYFSTLPTGDFTVGYIAEPDKYYGEYLESIHDLIMKITQILGAGTDAGIRNAQFFVNALPAELAAKLPNAIVFSAVDRDITLASSTDPGAPGGTKHTFTFGNYLDEVDLHVPVMRVSGIGEFGPSGDTTSPSTTQADVLDFIATGLPFVNQTVRLAVYGDAFIAGDVHALGQLITTQGETIVNSQVTHGDTILGDDTTDKTYVSGDLDVTGGITALGVTKDHTFDRSIVFTDGALRGVSGYICEIDDLDPSLIERVRKQYVGNAHDCVLEGREANSGLPFQITTVGAANELISTGISASTTTTVPSGSYFVGKYGYGEEWWAVCTLAGNGREANLGVHVPIASLDTATPKYVLTRNLPVVPGLNDYFYVYRRFGGMSSYLVQAGTNTVGIIGNPGFPLVMERRGIIKILDTSNQTLAIPSTDATYYVFANMVTSNEESVPTFFYSTTETPSDRACPLGVVIVSGGVITAVYPYATQFKHDTHWMRWSSSPSGNDQTWLGTRSYTGMYLGPTNVAARRRVQILLAPELGGSTGPDWAQVQATTPAETGINVQMSNTGLVIDTSNAGALPFYGISDPLWMRVIVGEL